MDRPNLSTGVVLAIADFPTQVVAIDDGECISSATLRLLTESRHWFTGSAELEIKEKLGYVAPEFDAQKRRTATALNLSGSYTLRDGNIIEISSERFRCPELLFKPYLRDPQ
jgi:actin